MDPTLSRWLRHAAESADAAIVVHGPDTALLWANVEAARLLGISRDELSGKLAADPSFRLLDEGGALLPLERYPVMLALHTPSPVRDYIVGIERPNASNAWVKVSAEPRLADEVIEAVVVTFVDVTELHEARLALRRSERRLELAIQGLDAGSWEVDLADGSAWFSPRLETLLGLEPGTLGPNAESLRARVSSQDLPRVDAATEAHLERGEPYDVRSWMRHASGDWRYMRGIGATLRGSDGQPARMAGLLIDVTAEQEARLAKERLRTQAESAARLDSLAVLAGGVAHDFNNLLVGVLGAADTARDLLDQPAELSGVLDLIQQSARRAADLTQQLMAYAGRAPTVLSTVDLHEEVEALVRLVRGSAGRDAKITVSRGEGDVAVEADPTQLRQVLLNLLVNACEALPNGQGQVRIETASRRLDAAAARARGCPPGDYAILTVEDDGAGMDARVRARIFEPFFTTKASGHGLGLAAIHGLVRSHGGYVAVESAPGEGARFEVGMPRTAKPAETRSSSEALAPVQRPRRALVVDDEDMVRKVTCRMLELDGFEVDALADGTGLAAHLFERPPDLLVLDVTLGEQSGLDLHEELRSHDQALPVILMSGHIDAEERVELSAAVPTRFLPKPFRRSDLRERVQELLGE